MSSVEQAVTTAPLPGRDDPRADQPAPNDASNATSTTMIPEGITQRGAPDLASVPSGGAGVAGALGAADGGGGGAGGELGDRASGGTAACSSFTA
jgi:hypothetical protein